MKKIRVRLKEVPRKTGVYLFKNSAGEVIYVGKARSLRTRVHSYFQRAHPESEKLDSLTAEIYDLDYILTENELESLLLECTLIKKYSPRFNVRFKDDTGYPFLKLTDEEYPRLLFARRREDDGARYFGPYASAKSVRRTIRFLNRIFPLRLCRDMKKEPCMYFHIEKCAAPCAGNISGDEYKKYVNAVRLFLEGRQRKVLNQLRRDMKEAAGKMNFERAGVLRDRIAALESVIDSTQKVVLPNTKDRDVVGLALQDVRVCAELLLVRDGMVAGHRPFFMEMSLDATLSSAAAGFLKNYYTAAGDFPAQILVGVEPEEKELIQKMLAEMSGRKVEIIVPQKGKLRELVRMADENAAHRLAVEMRREEERGEWVKVITTALREKLSDGTVLHRVVGFDISTIQRTSTVGAAVTFVDGAPYKSGYRKFIIRGKADDFSAMKEMAQRYFRRVKDGSEEKPDLVIVDGGRAQLTAVAESLGEVDMAELPTIIAFAKESLIAHRMGGEEVIEFRQGENALQLVKRVMDEAHRFAITFHRRKRQKKMYD
ncbi:MAG: excinuclease ABC subunit UvrC [bacterium]